jgi:hypothetical protein
MACSIPKEPRKRPQLACFKVHFTFLYNALCTRRGTSKVANRSGKEEVWRSENKTSTQNTMELLCLNSANHMSCNKRVSLTSICTALPNHQAHSPSVQLVLSPPVLKPAAPALCLEPAVGSPALAAPAAPCCNIRLPPAHAPNDSIARKSPSST